MGACSDMWLDEVERIGEEYALDKLTREEAMKALRRKGLDPHEAQDLLDEAVA